MYKKIVSIFLSITIFILLLPTVITSANSSLDNNSEIPSDGESRVYCEASLDDNFENDTVIITFKHENSEINKKFKPSDFKNVEVESVEDLTYIEGNVKSNELINREEFHQIISLKLKTKGKSNVLKAITELEKREDILAVEPEFLYEVKDIPVETKPSGSNIRLFAAAPTNDSMYDRQWGLHKIKADEAWSITRGSRNVKVGVMEDAIPQHEDLKENLLPGWNGDTNSPLVPGIYDYLNHHATHVAGIIGAVGNNGIGISGVAQQVSLVNLTGNSMVNIINYAMNNNIQIINASFHYEVYDDYGNLIIAPRNGSHEQAIRNYNGILVCSGGNDAINNDVTPRYPANYSLTLNNVITVAATDQSDNLASFSNYGATSVHLAAPGVDIWSTVTEHLYIPLGGTSMAAPHVTGVAALIKAKYPDINAADIKTAILKGVDEVPALNGKVLSGGRLNAKKALEKAAKITEIVEVSNYSQLKAAVENPDVQHIKLLNDITVTDLIYIKADVVTGYDRYLQFLGNKTLKLVGGNFAVEGNNTVLDLGNIILDGGKIIGSRDHHDSLTINGGTIQNARGGGIGGSFGESVELNGTTIKGCGSMENQATGDYMHSQAGAINVGTKYLTVNNCKFYNNTHRNGGAILLSSQIVRINDSIFEDNSAEYGGAICSSDYGVGTIYINNSKFSGNKARYGGAICADRVICGYGSYAPTDSNVHLYNTAISSNEAENGGGGICSGGLLSIGSPIDICDNRVTDGGCGGAIYSTGVLNISGGGLIKNNTVNYGGEGGGIYSTGDVNIDTVQITENKITNEEGGEGKGGGIYATGRLSINGATISNNEAFDGGGIYLKSGSNFSTGGQYVYPTGMRWTAIVNNRAQNNGGGVYISPRASASIGSFTNILNNIAMLGYGGGIYAGGKLDNQDSPVEISNNIGGDVYYP